MDHRCPRCGSNRVEKVYGEQYCLDCCRVISPVDYIKAECERLALVDERGSQ